MCIWTPYGLRRACFVELIRSAGEKFMYLPFLLSLLYIVMYEVIETSMKAINGVENFFIYQTNSEFLLWY